MVASCLAIYNGVSPVDYIPWETGKTATLMFHPFGRLSRISRISLSALILATLSSIVSPTGEMVVALVAILIRLFAMTWWTFFIHFAWAIAFSSSAMSVTPSSSRSWFGVVRDVLPRPTGSISISGILFHKLRKWSYWLLFCILCLKCSTLCKWGSVLLMTPESSLWSLLSLVVVANASVYIPRYQSFWIFEFAWV